jgi:large conductance mechanosensitive channel
MFKGFKEFILRGNVIDLAVAVVIGAAFTAIVNSLVTGVLNPLIALLFDAKDLADAGAEITVGGNTQVIAWGLVISSVIQFLLIAAVIYFAVIVPINYLSRVAAARRAKEVEEDEADPAPPTELELLTQIRDLLSEKQLAVGTTHGKHDLPPAD